ncbi:MAG: Uncharacterised protein [Acidimicrobiales bacterium AG-410-I20]|nr:MAG: Uncharacterised protein [Acidimicrobiales bacterium AG-410-I20]
MVKPLILIPPSEGKSSGGTQPCWLETDQSFKNLEAPRLQVVSSLIEAMKEPESDRAKLLGVKGKKVAEATLSNREIQKAETLPAIERYTGVLYDALNYSALSEGLKRKIDQQVVIFSGLWGIVKPKDLIPDYKLKMGAKLPEIGVLSRFWKPHLTSALGETDISCVWDLLPGEHSAGWDPGIAQKRIRVKFLDEVIRDGEKKLVSVSHWNKLLKGALVQYVVDKQLVDPDGLIDFSHPEGYVFAPDHSITTGNTIDIALISKR